MNQTIEFEDKYLVLKHSDIEKYLDDSQQKTLLKCIYAIAKGRINDDKPDFNEYLIINTDEPYIGEVAKIMKEHGHYTPGGELRINA